MVDLYQKGKLIIEKFRSRSFLFGTHLSTVLLIVVLAMLFIILLGKMKSTVNPFGPLEINREYLIARHIVTYHEFPLAGPWHSAFGAVRHSPVYFYFLALIVAIKDNIWSIRIANVILQIASLVFLFSLTRKIFGAGTALIAASLFGFSQLFIDFAQYPGHPNFQHSFLILSYLLLFISYQKKQFTTLLASIVTFVFASALHSAALLVFPSFLIIIFLICRGQKRRSHHYFTLLAVTAASFLLCYGTVVIDAYKNGVSVPNAILRSSRYITSFSEFSGNVFSHVNFLFNLFFPAYTLRGFSFITVLIFILLPILLCYHLFVQKENKQNTYMLILIGAMVQFFLMISLLKVTTYSYYFIPIAGIFMMVFARIIFVSNLKHISFLAVQPLIFFIVLKTFSFDYDLHNFKQYGLNESASLVSFMSLRPSTQEPKSPKTVQLNSIIASLKTEVLRIQIQEGHSDLDFFQIRFYEDRSPTLIDDDRNGIPIYDAIFYTPLEREFNKKLVSTVNNNYDQSFYAYRYFSYTPVTTDGYILLICYSHYGAGPQGCSETFLNEHRSHEIKKQIYSENPFTVFITKKRVPI